MGDISFDNSKSLCSSDERTTGTCKCTGCGQIEVYMANFDRGITCIETAGSFSVNKVDGPICNTLYNTAVDAMAFGNYDAEPTCTSTTTSGTCKCTGAQQIDAYMTNYTIGETCIDNGDDTSSWSPAPSCDGSAVNTVICKCGTATCAAGYLCDVNNNQCSAPTCATQDGSAVNNDVCKCGAETCGAGNFCDANLNKCTDPNQDSYAGTFDNSKPLCSATTSGTCKCTGCGQIKVYMTNLDNGEGCIDNGDSTSTWSKRASTAVHGTCEGFKCPSSFELKTNPTEISCTSFTCSKRYDLKVCCDVTTNAAGIYGRTENNEEDCNDADLCPGCVNEFGKVLVECKCLKHSDYKDYRTIIADTGDYCNKDGLWSKKTIEITGDSNDAANMKTQLIDTNIDGGEDDLHVETLNYFNNRNASQEAEDTMNYGYVEPVSGNGGKTYGCADKCIWNHKNERNIQMHDTSRRLSGLLRAFRLKSASVPDYDKRGTDVCKTESCALCTMCKVEAATKKYGFKPQVHKFIGLDGQISEYDAGCDATCENKGDDYDTTGRTLRISAPNGMVSMTKAQQEDNFANQKSVYSLDAAGTKGKILTINKQVGAITYIVADVTYTLDFKDNECLPTEFKIVSIEGSLSYHFTAQTLTFQAPVAGYDLKYYCEGKSLIGGIIKSHDPVNIKKLRTCNDAACSGCTSCNHLSGTDAVTSTYQPYADCTSETCQKAIDFFAPESPDEDTAGDGSRIGGGCKEWCEKAFYGIGQYWPSFRHEVENFAPDDIYDNVNAFREDKVCAWQRCSGCVRCKKRALNEEFAEKESLDDLGDTKYQRQKEALLGGCNMRGKTASDNCKLAWAAADANRKTELCSDRQASGLDCTGCKKCESEFGTATESTITVDKKSGANRAIDCPNARFCTEARSQQQKWQRRGCVPECITNP